MISPYKGAFKVTQPFKGSIHDGLDLVGLDSKEVRSTVNGTVEWAYWENAADKKQGFGLYVRIKQKGSTDKHYFGHLSALKVKPGQDVKAGDSRACRARADRRRVPAHRAPSRNRHPRYTSK